MNKIYITLLVLLAFCSCNPMGDIYDNLDGVKQPIANKIEYTLTDANYGVIGDLALKRKTKEDSVAGKLIKDKKYFDGKAPIAEYLPAFLLSTFPGLQTNSSVMVTYNFNEANYPNIGKIVLSPVNYQNVGGSVGGYLCFMESDYAPSRNDMTKALKDVSAEDGELKLVTYNQAVGSNAGKTQNMISVTLNKFDYLNIFNWASKNKVDFLSSDKSVEYWFGSGKNNPNFDIRLDKWTAYTHPETVTKDYITSQVHKGIMLALESKFGKAATVNVIYNVEYAVYDGKNKTLTQAFKCITAGSKPVFEIYTDPVDAIETEEVTTVYQYSQQYNNWSSYTNGIYILTVDDYKDLGFDAFTSDKPSVNYLPALLAIRFSYAQPGEEIVVVSKNDNGKAFVLYTDRYILTDGIWVKYNPVIVKTDQFVYNKDKWVFDPTVNHTMVKEDYDVLVQWVKNNKNNYFDAKYQNAEYWFGSSTYKDNFDIRLAIRKSNDPEGLFTGKSESEVIKIMDDKIQEGILIFLESRYKDATPQKDGMDMYYKVTYTTYDGSYHTNMVKYKCISVGKFELSEEPIEMK